MAVPSNGVIKIKHRVEAVSCRMRRQPSDNLLCLFFIQTSMTGPLFLSSNKEGTKKSTAIVLALPNGTPPLFPLCPKSLLRDVVW